MSTRCQIEFMNISTREEKEGPEKGKLVKVVEEERYTGIVMAIRKVCSQT